MADARCDFPGCSYRIVGAPSAVDAARAVDKHEARAHPTAAEARFVVEHPDSREPGRVLEREAGCGCPVEVFDPDCPLHAWDAVW